MAFIIHVSQMIPGVYTSGARWIWLVVDNERFPFPEMVMKTKQQLEAVPSAPIIHMYAIDHYVEPS